MQTNTDKKFLFFPLFLVLYEFTVYLSNDMIMPGMIQVVREFAASDAYIPYSMTANLLGGSSLQIFLGPISDRYGRRPVMLYGALFFFLSTIYTLFCHDINQYIFARFIQGMGLCFVFVIGYVSIQEMYEEKKAIKIISLMAIVALIAPLIGPLAGGAYCQYFSWRGVFVIIGVLSFIAMVGLYFYMPETATKEVQGNVFKNYWLVLKNKKFIFGTLAYILSGVPLISWIAISPVILMDKAGLSPINYGLCQIPVFGSLMLGNFLVQKIIHRVEIEKIIIVACSLIFISLSLCAILPALFGESFLLLLIPFSLYSFGVALANAPFIRRILFASSLPKGTVSATLNILGMSLYALGTYLMSYVYAQKSNVHFGLFCLTMGFIFLPFLRLFFRENNLIDKVNE